MSEPDVPLEERIEHLSPLEKYEAACREQWFRGDLWHVCLEGGQQTAYERVQKWCEDNPKHSGPLCLLCHRGLGKTALLLLVALQLALKLGGRLCRIAGPELKEIRAAAEPTLRVFSAMRPAEIEIDPIDDGYRIHNPRTMRPGEFSELTYVGLRELGDKRRGIRADFIAVDEARNIANLSYVIDSVLRPMFVTRAHPLMIIATTSPRTAGHEFWDYADRAEKHGRFIYIPVTENPAYKDMPTEQLESYFGPIDSVSWNREAMCKKAADDKLLAIPSFTRKKDKILIASERPDFFFPYVFGDMGFIDCAAFLFAYVDNARQKLVVEDELVEASLGTPQLHAKLKQMELALYGNAVNYKRIRRWVDATPRELDDLRQAKLYFQPAKKGEERWDKWTGLARLEGCLHAERIEIHPRCKSLVYQLENAIKNEHHTDLRREAPKENQDITAPVMGHQDALWALAYGVWQLRHSWLLDPVVQQPVEGQVYRSSVREESQGLRIGELEITNRPLVITEYSDHIQGADRGRRTIGGRRVTF